jgi:DMSO/TMAO reductase YedYZ molybdopterin-dependent catalytic subunit
MGFFNRWSGVAIIAIMVIIASAFIGLTVRSNEEITPNDQFFTESIGPPPLVNVSDYHLRIDGLVKQPFDLKYSEIRALPSTSEVVTLDCVTGQSGRANWTGISLKELLDSAQINDTATKVAFFCADGYSTSLTIAGARTSGVILAYEMNGVALPVDHGFPMRLVVPNNWGYKWAKWVTHIQVIDNDFKGYWEKAGWADDATITPISDWRLHATLLSITAVLGGFSALSGLKNAENARAAKALPKFFAKKYHRYVSAVYYLLLFGTFLFWAAQTFELRGALFYSLHGRLALLTMIFSIIGIISGLPMLAKPSRLRWLHWVSNMTAYLLLLATVVLGILKLFT